MGPGAPLPDCGPPDSPYVQGTCDKLHPCSCAFAPQAPVESRSRARCPARCWTNTPTETHGLLSCNQSSRKNHLSMTQRIFSTNVMNVLKKSKSRCESITRGPSLAVGRSVKAFRDILGGAGEAARLGSGAGEEAGTPRGQGSSGRPQEGPGNKHRTKPRVAGGATRHRWAGLCTTHSVHTGNGAPPSLMQQNGCSERGMDVHNSHHQHWESGSGTEGSYVSVNLHNSHRLRCSDRGWTGGQGADYEGPSRP